MTADEEWRPIEDEPGYDVSNFGEVRSHKPVRNFAKPPVEPRILKFKRDKDGYRSVSLHQKGRGGRDYRVHQLVCAAFNGPRPNGALCLHNDGDNDNNRPDNLRWGTAKQNSDDSKDHGTWVHGRKTNTARLTEDDVRYVRSSADGHSTLAKKYDVTPCAIWHIRAGRTWKHVA